MIMKLTKIMAIAAVCALALSFEACAKSAEKAAAEEYAEVNMDKPSNVQTPTSDDQFRPGFKPSKPTLIDFNALWCGPCRLLTPGFDLAAASYGDRVDFYSINVDSFPATATAYNVRSIPYVMLVMPDGTMTEHIGLTDFVEGLDPNSEPTQEQLDNAIYTNIAKMLDSALKK